MVEMSKDDGRPAIDAAHGDGMVAPFAETGGMGLAKRDENGFIVEERPLRADIVSTFGTVAIKASARKMRFHCLIASFFLSLAPTACLLFAPHAFHPPSYLAARPNQEDAQIKKVGAAEANRC